MGTQIVLSVSTKFKADAGIDNGIINAVVQSDVYSADGTKVLIAAGTPAIIDYTLDSNGAWGKAGRVCVTNATTKTIDNKTVSLRLGTCKKGGSKVAGVIIISLLFFPVGLLSGFMKGSNPKFNVGTPFNATVMQSVVVD